MTGDHVYPCSFIYIYRPVLNDLYSITQTSGSVRSVILTPLHLGLLSTIFELSI
jgi:hypothetical protein